MSEALCMTKQVGKLLILTGLLVTQACHHYSTRPVFSGPELLSSGKEWRMYPVITDFNADGKPDIVATHRRPLYENSLHFFAGAGDGKFTELAPTWSSPGYSGVALADINGDEKLDVLAVSHFNRIHTYLGTDKGVGYFDESVMPTNDGYVQARLVDLIGDKTPEAVVLGNEKAGIEIYKWNKNGWSILQRHLENKIGREFAIADMNRDGRQDLVVSVLREGVIILLQDDTGQFRPGAATNFFSATRDFRNVAVADLNKDGCLDIALNGGYAGVATSNGPDVYLSDCKEGWLASSRGLKQLKNAAEGLVIGDVNQDGHLDLIAGGKIASSIDEKAYGMFVFLGDGQGNWSLQKHSGLPPTGLSRPYGLVQADLNGDNLPDLVATHGAPEEGVGYVSIWLASKEGPEAARS